MTQSARARRICASVASSPLGPSNNQRVGPPCGPTSGHIGSEASKFDDPKGSSGSMPLPPMYNIVRVGDLFCRAYGGVCVQEEQRQARNCSPHSPGAGGAPSWRIPVAVLGIRTMWSAFHTAARRSLQPGQMKPSGSLRQKMASGIRKASAPSHRVYALAASRDTLHLERPESTG